MNVDRHRCVSVCVCGLALWSILTSWCSADEGSEIGKLLHVSSISRVSLRMVTSVEVSNDGRFLYSAAWQAAAITVFERNRLTGELTHVQEIVDPRGLLGVTALRLSPDGRYAAATSFRSQCLVLYRRNPQDGKLQRLSLAKDNVKGVTGLRFAVDVGFSPDSKFLYVIDTKGPGRLPLVETGSVTAFRISDEGELVFIEANTGRDNCFTGLRGIVVHPDGKMIVATASTAGTLVVLDRNITTGVTTVRQVIKDGEGKVRGLDGAMGVALSPDGQFVYTSAGRFRGDHAIGVYKFDEAGKLTVVQEIVNGEDGLHNFEGGNEISISSDGRNVYAVASESESLACFNRNTLTGELTFVETLANEADRLSAVAGIGLSPDDLFVYVAAESASAISCYRRMIEDSSSTKATAKQVEPVKPAKLTKQASAIQKQDVAFVGVEVIPMDRKVILNDMTVTVVNGRIHDMGSAGSVAIPKGALIIQGKGKYLMPGLVDMHVHTWFEEELTLFLANGVTMVRNMFGSPMHLKWRSEIEQGMRLGPTIYTAGPIVDGKPAVWPNSREVTTPEEAREAVREHVQQGYDFIKVYNGLSKEAYLALVMAAKESSLQVAGHVPDQVGLSGVLDAKQRTIEHLDGFQTFLKSPESPQQDKTSIKSRFLEWGQIDSNRIPQVIEKLKQAGTWNCVTLVVANKSLSIKELKKELELPYMKFLPPMQIDQWTSMTNSIPPSVVETMRSIQTPRSKLTGALNDAGVPILMGTDMGNPWVVAGFSVHQELASLVEAGLTPYEALRASTRIPAECLEAQSEFGTVAKGLRADLLLLEANPLEDVANAARRVGVMVRGKWLPASELQQMLEKLSSKNKEAVEAE
jgi:6-phosphogluconolactonase (cycloisomerase 2 family)